MVPSLLLAASLLLAQPAAFPAPARGTITVAVSAVKGSEGALRVRLVASGEGFPGSDAHVLAKQRLAAKGAGEARFVFEGVAYGEYAVVCLHDADDDGELDRSLLGLPSEGLGFSNGARIRFGPPSFAEARFVLAAPELELPVELQY